MKKSFLFLFLFSSVILYSQNGYIVNENDTIKANIEMNNFKVSTNVKQEKLQKKVKITINGQEKTYNAGDLKSFCFQNDEFFCFDNFGEGDEAIFLLRIANDKKQNFKIYQISNSYFFGVNYSTSLGYLIKRKGEKDIFFSPKTRKGWKESLLDIVKNCPEIHEKFSKNIDGIAFAEDFKNYVKEYSEKCFK